MHDGGFGGAAGLKFRQDGLSQLCSLGGESDLREAKARTHSSAGESSLDDSRRVRITKTVDGVHLSSEQRPGRGYNSTVRQWKGEEGRERADAVGS